MNVFTIVFYLMVLFLIFWQAKFTGFRTVSSNPMSIQNTTSLKGLMAFLVLCHHISQKSAFKTAGEIQIFEQIGFLFVGIFFFISGFGLYKSFKNKSGYFNGFFKRRMLPLIIAWYVMVLFYVIYQLITKVQKPAGRWVTDIIGLTLINSQSWYVISILLLYGVTALAYKHCKSERNAFIIVLCSAVVHCLLFIFIGHFLWFTGPKDWWRQPYAVWNPALAWWKKPMTWWFHGEWWANSTLCFPFGIWFAGKEEKFRNWMSKHFGIKALLWIVLYAGICYASLITFWEYNYWKVWGSDAFLFNAICIAVQNFWAVASCMFVYTILLKFDLSNPLLSFMGKRSLEIYLVQEMVLFTFAPVILKDAYDQVGIIWDNHLNLVIYATCVIAWVIVLAVIYSAVNRGLTWRLKK